MIKINNVYYMLAYSYKTLNPKDKKYYAEEKFDNIYDLFAVMIDQCVNRQIRRGLVKEYITKNDNLKSLRGKIKISESIKKNTKRTNSLICEFDEYSINSYFNRIVKTAMLYLVKSNNIKDNKKKKNLLKKIIYFKNIEEIKEVKKIRWNTMRFNNKTISYRFLMEICKLILNDLYIGKDEGKLQFNTFLEDKAMANLYESFIREYYKVNELDLNISKNNISWNYDASDAIGLISNVPSMETDISISNYYNNDQLIIDAKFYTDSLKEHFDKDLFNSMNLYQIYSYVKNKDKDKVGNVLGMLLYAKTDKDELGWTQVNMDGNYLVITDLDLNSDFRIIEEKLGDIIKWYKKEISLKELDEKYNKKIFIRD